MLEHLCVTDGDLHGVSSLLDRARLEEPQFEDPSIPLGKGSEDFASSLWSVSGFLWDAFLRERIQIGFWIDGRDGHAKSPAPV